MIPGHGPYCDLCIPDVHYLLTCACGHEWDEPPCPGSFTCCVCGAVAVVTSAEDEAWERDVLGIAT